MPITIGDIVDLSWPYGVSTTATVTVIAPDATTSSPTVSGTSTFTAPFLTTMPGLHVATWVGTTVNTGSYVEVFNVESASDQPIVSLAAAKNALNIHLASTDDELLDILIAITEVCEKRTGQTWRRKTIVDTFDGGASVIHLEHRPVLSVTSVVEYGVTLNPTVDYTLDPDDGLLYRGDTVTPLTWMQGRQNVTVTYVVGPEDGIVPGYIRRGFLEMLRHVWNNQRGGSNLPRQAGATDEWDPQAGFSIPRRALEWWGIADNAGPMVR